MAYTWTNGELITAEKLNNTGGGYDVVIKTTATTLSGVNTSNTVLEKGSWADIVDICRSGRVPSVYMYGYNYVDENEWYAVQYNVSGIYADMGYNDCFQFYVTGGYVLDDSYKKGYMASSSGGSPTSLIYAPRNVRLIVISESGLTVSDL